MTETLAPTPDWGAEVVIVPYSGIQFLDFGFALDAVDARRRRFLWLERVVGTRDGQDERMLIPLTGNADADAAQEAGARSDDTRYTIRDTEALEPFLSKWVPVPVLKVARDRGPQGEELYDAGPTTWARLRIVELAAPDPRTGHTHRIQLALDTRLEPEAGPPTPGLPEEYLAPRREDARQECDFRLVADPRRIGWFLTRPVTAPDGEAEDLQRWVSDWILDMMRGVRRKQDALFEHWARYLSLLGLIDAAVRVPRLRLANTVGGRDARLPIEVDLVLDVGNARTCGIFIERVPGETAVAIDRAYRLELRDLSRPEFLYRDLFESRIEFADHRMGDDLHASNSGRRDAFLWPSFCRIGPEAMRMVAGTSGTESDSGLSSPKRYLWDGARRLQDWRFHDRTSSLMLPRVVNAALPHLTEDGDVREQVAQDRLDGIRPRGPEPMMAQNPRFSRSSLFTFLLTEIFAHALAQVNAPGSRHVRAQADRPRHLARIILTMPTATTAQEQAIILSRAKGALHLVRRLTGASDNDSNTSRMPTLTVEWDEASCTQLVYLYAELVQKFGGRIERFLTLMGRPRPRVAGDAAAPSLRLACIDIGGGTTDLMVTTYWGEADRMLHPVQTFREGFRVGGDELVNRVIARLVLPQMQRAIERAGGRGVGEKLRELFGGNVQGTEQQQSQRRRHFTVQVLIPLAIAVLNRCEAADEFDSLSLDAREVLGLPASSPEEEDEDDIFAVAGGAPRPGRALLAYVEGPAADLGARGFRLADLALTWTREEVDSIAREVFQRALGNMAEVIDHLGVDLVLLTGRPSRLAAVRSIFEEQLVLPPHRVVAMHTYRTGRWYPFRDPVTHRISDPKTTVAVGGLLIAMSETMIRNFKVDTRAFQMRSTARFIGEIEGSGQILDRNVLFRNVDLDKRRRRRGDDGLTATLQMYGPVHIGARQMPHERWTATPLYRLEFKGTIAGARHSLAVTLERDLPAEEAEGDESAARRVSNEVMREAFIVRDVQDGTARDVMIRLHTLGHEDTYWIDEGVFRL